jgi:hypothetical protein
MHAFYVDAYLALFYKRRVHVHKIAVRYCAVIRVFVCAIYGRLSSHLYANMVRCVHPRTADRQAQQLHLHACSLGWPV